MWPTEYDDNRLRALFSPQTATLTVDRVDLVAGLLVLESLNKRRSGIYRGRAGATRPTRSPRPGAHSRAAGPPRQGERVRALALEPHDRLVRCACCPGFGRAGRSSRLAKGRPASHQITRKSVETTCSVNPSVDMRFTHSSREASAYLKNTLTKIAEGHPINRIVELMPWRIASLDAAQPE